MNKLAEKYLRPSQIPTKACHGCGIGMIENWLLQAIDELGLGQDDVILGTGIGCVGRQTYATWAGDNLGATHGRVLAVATFVAETTAVQWNQTVKFVKKALQNDGFSFVHIRFPCNENFGAYALGTRDTLKNIEWIWEHTKGRTTDGDETDLTWDTGIKHDASNSRPEFSSILRTMNDGVRKKMAGKESGNGQS